MQGKYFVLEATKMDCIVLCEALKPASTAAEQSAADARVAAFLSSHPATASDFENFLNSAGGLGWREAGLHNRNLVQLNLSCSSQDAASAYGYTGTL